VSAAASGAVVPCTAAASALLDRVSAAQSPADDTAVVVRLQTQTRSMV
jgi:hypothetical protein